MSALAIEKITGLARFTRLPLSAPHVRVIRTSHRDPAKRVIVEVNLDVNGRPIRVQVAAANSRAGLDLAQARLRRKLSQLGRHRARLGGRQRSHRPGYENRPSGEREVLRRKTFEPARTTVEEAELDLEMMDYDFLLFTDALSGMDSLVCRGGPDDYQWVALAEAPRLALSAAVSLLDLTDAPFVFFADAGTDRGNVLYRRHDGHYGLITPAA
jgi:ribosome-associated translation inhibitor RaiA